MSTNNREKMERKYKGRILNIKYSAGNIMGFNDEGERLKAKGKRTMDEGRWTTDDAG